MTESNYVLIAELEVALRSAKIMSSALESELLISLLGIALQVVDELKTTMPPPEQPRLN